MKELNDDEFDRVFKNRITNEIPEFEAESWLKMEKKLRQRDRRVFLLNASIVLLLLSFGFGFYFMSRTISDVSKNNAGTKTAKIKQASPDKIKPEALVTPTSPHIPLNTLWRSPSSATRGGDSQKPFTEDKNLKDSVVLATTSHKAQVGDNITKITNGAQIATNTILSTTADQSFETAPLAINQREGEDAEKVTKKGARKKIPITLAINVGPDFNSTTSQIGGKAKISLGVGIGVGVSKRLSIQTGLNYGRKDYAVSSTEKSYYGNYTSTNAIDISAECKVIEVPLRGSFKVSENNKRLITVNAGLSSYVMLREKYVFSYNPALNRNNKVMDIRNGGQHILGVVDLSATYNIKLNNKKLALGLEPYLKIPLVGIGANSVPLKSSGLSLKMSYDFTK